METLRQIKQLSPSFLEHSRRVERTAGLDARLNEQWRVVEQQMNDLLEVYQIELIQVATGAQPILELTSINPPEEVEHGLGVE